MAVFGVKLNKAQREALAHWFEQGTQGVPVDGDEHPTNEPIVFGEARGQFVLNGTYLHRDGEWATFPEETEVRTFVITSESPLSVETTLTENEVREAVWDALKSLENETTFPNVQVSEFDVVEVERSAA